MHYKLVYSKKSDKQLGKLDNRTRTMILLWLDKNLKNTTNPREHGKAMTADKKGLWRYRVGDYRIICDIKDNELIILTLEIGHRSKIYKQ